MERMICILVVFTVCLLDGVMPQNKDWWRPVHRAKKFRDGEPTFIYTHGNNHWNQVWYTIPDRLEFVFGVKACSSVRLSLSTYIGIADYSVEIMLGEENNTKSMIKYPFQAGNLAETWTNEILSCYEYRTFWVTWIGDFIEVGRGPSVGQQQIMNWWDKSLHTINAIGLSSGDNTAATYEISGNTGDLIEVVTPNEYKYNTLWKAIKNRDFYSFQVRSCGDVHILLTEELGRQDGSLYEIAIGGWNNNVSVIRTNVYGGASSLKASHTEYGIVQCHEFKEFWISWYNKTISVGKGDIYAMRRFLRWESDIDVDVRYLSITTGFGNDGSWILDDDEETFTMLHTPQGNTSKPSEIYNTSWVDMPKELFFQFWVKAKGNEARVLLADDTEILDEEFDLQIVFGGDDPKKLCVGYMFEPGCLYDFYGTDDLIRDNQFNPFWISWFNKSLNIGQGYFYGERIMVKDGVMNTDFHINAIALATTRGWGRFKFREYMGERVEYRTPDTFTNYQDVTAWRTVYTKSSFIFYFWGDSDCHVTLSPTYGINHETCYYDLIISGWGDTKSVIREVCNYGAYEREVSAAVDTTGLLRNGIVDLWISWYNGLVEIGRGTVVGMRTFLQHNFGDALDVRALAVQTGWGYKGRFYMYEDLGDYTTIYTNGTDNPNGMSADHHMIMDAFLRFVTFWVTSCTEATVYLGQFQGDSKFDHFKIVFGADGNSKVKLYHEEQEVRSFDKTPVVECEDNRQYWIAWKDGKIEVGESYRYPYRKFFEFQQEMVYNVSYLGFKTLGNTESDIMGRWHIMHAYGPDFQMYTNKDFVYRDWFSVEHKDYVIFTVQACSDVHIALSERMGHTHLTSYEVVIGGWNNTRSVIREWIQDVHGTRLPEYVSVDSPGVNNCSAPQTFWISWHDGVIIVGKGLFIDRYRDAWIDYHPVNPRHIVALSFSTGYGFDGYWALNLNPDYGSPPISIEPPTDPPSSGGSSMSGGAIAGIVIAVLAVVVLFGAVGYLIMMTRGNVKTPEFLQTPAEGSGFENPVAETDNTNNTGDSTA